MINMQIFRESGLPEKSWPILDLVIKRLKSHAPLSKEAIKELLARLQAQTFDRNKCIVDYGEKMKMTGILFEGVLVSRYIDENYKEIASNFYYPQGDVLVVDYRSFVRQKPSEEKFLVVEKASILMLSREDYLFLIDHYPNMKYALMGFLEKYTLDLKNTIKDLKQLKACERVRKFMVKYKAIFNELLNKDIYTFLGISKTTFGDCMKKM